MQFHMPYIKFEFSSGQLLYLNNIKLPHTKFGKLPGIKIHGYIKSLKYPKQSINLLIRLESSCQSLSRFLQPALLHYCLLTLMFFSCNVNMPLTCTWTFCQWPRV